MDKINRIRLPIDIMMTLVSIVLMGGNYLFPADIVHEILGVALFVLWAVHIALNRRWYSALFRGKYNPYRVMQTVINCCILICTIFLMISGIILSNHVFTFLNIQGGLGFARIAHLLASHWYYLFMSLHIGLHVGMIKNKMCHPNTNRHPAPINCHPELVSGSSTNEMPKQVRHDTSTACHGGSSAQQECHSRAPTRESLDEKIIGSNPIMTGKSCPPRTLVVKILPRIVLALVCAYGVYAFIIRGVWKYLILQQQFFFFDLERGYILFAIDYISIIILFATISHLIAEWLKNSR